MVTWEKTESLHYRTKSPDVFHIWGGGGGGDSLFWLISLVVVGLVWMGVELGSPLVWGQIYEQIGLLFMTTSTQ